ncbi:helix-turn-helix domain-containing protein [Rubinisphaera brasiliensis]|uniref:DNA binding domain protein, excisionase family n=1 Tax=Rubinisphaera brasiliensis (strain ATCC 49424 / DSM 5305 / JCM 21570 / IAM 15109 / NBRC 103401 / IFAM 1448) TaxID=756272 RepID=F0SL22_RUBBR|nr:helix-turn-helix domain-containing protein [Rubinisphaera brasiliensis]ADY60905.1 DNA binding domain protein, excisionase family [Rubinisphaera brasiliensis DSM 5305]
MLESCNALQGQMLTYKDAASYLALSERTVWRLVKSGELKAAKVGGAVRIDPADLRDYVERSKQGA